MGLILKTVLLIMAVQSSIFNLQSSFCSAQVKVESTISAMEMLVGQQVMVTVSATADEGATVTFPQEALLPAGIEFMGAVEMPEQKADGGKVLYQRGYVLTSFEDTLYYIPPFTVNVDEVLRDIVHATEPVFKANTDYKINYTTSTTRYNDASTPETEKSENISSRLYWSTHPYQRR